MSGLPPVVTITGAPQTIIVEQDAETVLVVSETGDTSVIQVAERGPAGPTGTPGQTGPQGPAGSVGGYTFNQDLPLAVWVIPHNLGRKPSVTVYTSAGDEVIGDIESTTMETTLTFGAPFAGSAYLI